MADGDMAPRSTGAGSTSVGTPVGSTQVSSPTAGSSTAGSSVIASSVIAPGGTPSPAGSSLAGSSLAGSSVVGSQQIGHDAGHSTGHGELAPASEHGHAEPGPLHGTEDSWRGWVGVKVVFGILTVLMFIPMIWVTILQDGSMGAILSTSVPPLFVLGALLVGLRGRRR